MYWESVTKTPLSKEEVNRRMEINKAFIEQWKIENAKPSHRMNVVKRNPRRYKPVKTYDNKTVRSYVHNGDDRRSFKFRRRVKEKEYVKKFIKKWVDEPNGV